jgi:hypothetical protein
LILVYGLESADAQGQRLPILRTTS